MSKTIFVTIGAPASGKSSYYFFDFLQPDVVYISSDMIREELYGTAYDQRDPNKVFSEVRVKVALNLHRGKSVYLDATHARESWRAYIFELAKRYDARVGALYFRVPFMELVRRDRARERSVGWWVIFKYWFMLQKPTYAEGFDFITDVNTPF